MTTFEIILLFIYGVFAFSYMIKKFGINEEDDLYLKIMICILALTMGLIWFPATFAFDIYNKLNNNQKNIEEYEDEC